MVNAEFHILLQIGGAMYIHSFLQLVSVVTMKSNVRIRRVAFQYALLSTTC